MNNLSEFANFDELKKKFGGESGGGGGRGGGGVGRGGGGEAPGGGHRGGAKRKSAPRAPKTLATPPAEMGRTCPFTHLFYDVANGNFHYF